MHPNLKNSGFMNKRIWLLSFAIALGLQMQAQRQDDMRQTVEYLASQELGGRYPATHGDTLASEFIVSRARHETQAYSQRQEGNWLLSQLFLREEREAHHSQYHRRDSRQRTSG